MPRPSSLRFVCCSIPSIAAAVLVMALGSGTAQAAPEAKPSPTSQQAPTSPTQTAPIPDTLRVTVEPTIDDAELFPQWIAERSGAAVGEIAQPPGHTQWVEVKIEGATFDYRFTVTAMRDGKPVGEPGASIAHEGTSEELLKKIDQAIGRAVEQLAEAPIEATSEETQPLPETAYDPSKYVAIEDIPKDCIPTGYTPPPDVPEGMILKVLVDRECLESHCVSDCKEERPLGPLGWTGVGLVAAGGAGIVAGSVMIGVGIRPPITGLRSAQRDWRNPTGYAVLGAGGALLLAGLPMLIVDLTRCKRRCEKRASERLSGIGHSGTRRRTIAWTPVIGRTVTGLSLSGRF